jgi:hypothetical protein
MIPEEKIFEYNSELPKIRKGSKESLRKFRNELGYLVDNFTSCKIYDVFGVGSRRLLRFVKGEDNLTIMPEMLLELWLVIIDPKITKTKSPDAEQKRKELKQQGPNLWFEQLGFQRPDELNQKVPINRLHLLRQVVNSLCTRLIADKDFEALVELILKSAEQCYHLPSEVLDQVVHKKSSTTANIVSNSDDLPTIKQAIRQVEYFLSQREGYPKWKIDTVKKEFIEAVEYIEGSGKTFLSESEIIGLFLSIDYKVNNRARDLIEKKLEIKTLNCEITSPSIRFESDFIDILLENLPTDVDLPNIKRAIITCQICLPQSEKPFVIEWRYASNGTILNNLTIAVENGIGYRDHLLELQPTIQALGNNISGLADIKVRYKYFDGRLFRGQWVGLDTFSCFARALTICGEDWLYSTYESLSLYFEEFVNKKYITSKDSEKSEENFECHHLNSALDGVTYYFKQSENIANLRNRIQLNNIYAYRINPVDLNQNSNEKLSLKNILNEINSLATQMNNDDKLYKKLLKKTTDEPFIFKSYLSELPRLKVVAYLSQVRASIIRGDLCYAERIQQNNDFKVALAEANSLNLNNLKKAEDLLWDLSVGQITQHDNLKKCTSEELLNYVHLDEPFGSTPEKLSNTHYQNLQVDDYLAAAEVYGNAARINFYSSSDELILRRTASWFEIAALYSSKVGYEKRCSHWLCIASRTWLRLGNWERAKKFYEQAERIAQYSLSTSSLVVNRTYVSDIYLARGEYYLHQTELENSKELALIFFTKALLGASFRGFSRRVADCLYGLGKASAAVDKISLGQILMPSQTLIKSNNKIPQVTNFLGGLDFVVQEVSNWKNMFPQECDWIFPFERVTNLLRKFQSNLNVTWADVSTELIEASAETWNNWALQGGFDAHPFAEEIRQKNLLCSVSSKKP